MKTEIITEVMPELLDSMINEAHQHHLNIGQYSDADSIKDYIELHFRDEIVEQVKNRVNWESWLVIELNGLDIPQEPGRIAGYVNHCINESIWYECWEGGTFAASQYIETQCSLLGYTGELDDSPAASDNAERAKACREGF